MQQVRWLWIGALALCSCQPSQKSATNQTTDNETAVDPSNITGTYLSCTPVTSSTANSVAVGCNLLEAGQKVNFGSIAKNMTWEAYGLDKTLDYNVDENSGGYQAVYHFPAANANIIDQVSMCVKITTFTDIVLVLRQDVSARIQKLSGHRYVRQTIISLHSLQEAQQNGAPANAIEGIYTELYTSIQINLNNVWTPIKLTNGKFYAGKYPVTIDGNSYDQQILTNLYTANPNYGINALSSYSTTPPHDYVSTPANVIFDFGSDLVKVALLRANDDAIVPLIKRPTGMPDVYYFSYSDDGMTWMPVKESIVNFEDNPELLNGPYYQDASAGD